MPSLVGQKVKVEGWRKGWRRCGGGGGGSQGRVGRKDGSGMKNKGPHKVEAVFSKAQVFNRLSFVIKS